MITSNEAQRLQIDNLQKTYPGNVRALGGVSLSLGNGLLGLLGPNGSGKSTLIRTLATLQKPDSGTVLYNGTDIHQNPNLMRNALGYLPQEFGVFPKATARQLLHYIAALKGLKNPQIDHVLAVTNLEADQHRFVAQYSGGMLRRFGIAQALLGEPKILIVDEPTAGLDPQERHRFHNLLCEVGAHMIVILSTHLVEDVRELCSRIAILNGGLIRYEGTPHDLATPLAGKLWRCLEADFQPHSSAITVLSTRVRAGRKWVRVVSPTCPGQEYVPAEPDMEDGYFMALQQEANHG